jgi:hypothetical protein
LYQPSCSPDRLHFLHTLSVNTTSCDTPNRQYTNAMTSRSSRPSNDGTATPKGFKHCQACKIYVPSFLWAQHTNYKRHRKLQRINDTQSALEQAEWDKNGITVSARDTGVDFGIIETEDSLEASTCQSLTLTIRKTETEGRIYLDSFQLTSLIQQSVHGTR